MGDCRVQAYGGEHAQRVRIVPVLIQKVCTATSMHPRRLITAFRGLCCLPDSVFSCICGAMPMDVQRDCCPG